MRAEEIAVVLNANGNDRNSVSYVKEQAEEGEEDERKSEASSFCSQKSP